MITKAKKNIFAIIGSASENSSNLKLVNQIAELTKEDFIVTVFADLALLSGQKGHDELKLIMKTVEANFTEATTLLIPGIKSKIDEEGNILDKHIQEKLSSFIESFRELVANAN